MSKISERPKGLLLRRMYSFISSQSQRHYQCEGSRRSCSTSSILRDARAMCSPARQGSSLRKFRSAFSQFKFSFVRSRDRVTAAGSIICAVVYSGRAPSDGGKKGEGNWPIASSWRRALRKKIIFYKTKWDKLDSVVQMYNWGTEREDFPLLLSGYYHGDHLLSTCRSCTQEPEKGDDTCSKCFKNRFIFRS